MQQTPQAHLDRRVRILEGDAEQRSASQRMSDLTQAPYVVLLGSPGMGKSSVFAAAASAESAEIHKVRHLVTGGPVPSCDRIFLDALDEYRSEGDPADKLYALAHKLEATGVKSWRISCREEDWRKAADLGVLAAACRGSPIIVAQLMGLEPLEAAAILSARGEADPESFLQRAASLGASALIESPLVLTLLQTAVANNGAWPQSRFELFTQAVRAMAFEENIEHRHRRDRSGIEKILAAADEMNLILLCSGARAIWRTHSAPPSNGDARAFIGPDDIGLPAALFSDTLDTALFLGEGEAFEPHHRAVAEFMAGRALARAVHGGDRPAIPLSRALALIGGRDDAPPTELRGLYAWFAAHLAQLGDAEAAQQLIAADAFTVAAYGDARAFDLRLRRALLDGLAAQDPYFRNAESSDATLGGLASEDLVPELSAVLEDHAEEMTHRFVSVLDALATGSPVHSLRPRLRQMFLDPALPEWKRGRILDAWLNGAEDSDAARRRLLTELSAEPPSRAREVLRVKLAAALPAADLSDDELMAIVQAFRVSPEDQTVGHLYPLLHKLRTAPRPSLFDRPINAWLGREDRERGDLEVDSLLDSSFAAAIAATPDLSAERLWTWLRNRDRLVYVRLDDAVREAITDWLDRGANRDLELAFAMLANDDPDETGPHWLGVAFNRLTQRPPPASLPMDLLRGTRAQATPRRDLIACNLVLRGDAPGEAYWRVQDHLETAGRRDLLALVTTCPLEDWKLEEMTRQSVHQNRMAARNASEHAARIKLIPEIEAVGHHGLLYEAAKVYVGWNGGEDQQPGWARLETSWGSEVAAAVDRGWAKLLRDSDPVLQPVSLGRVEAESKTYYLEYAAVAAVVRQMETNPEAPLSAIPLELALAAFRNMDLASRSARADLMQRLEARINHEAEAGADAIVSYVRAIVLAGQDRPRILDLLASRRTEGPAITLAVERLLGEPESLSPGTLDDLLILAARVTPPSRLLQMAKTHLESGKLQRGHATLWRFAAFALDPTGHRPRFSSSTVVRGAVRRVRRYVSGSLYSAFDHLDPSLRAAREAAVIEVFSGHVPPVGFWDDDDDDETPQVGARRRRGRRESDWIDRSIRLLATPATADACSRLQRLSQRPDVGGWAPKLRHAAAEQARRFRDASFVHPEPAAIQRLLASGPPSNGADLLAIVLDQLNALALHMRTGNTTPWKVFWNTDAYGRAIEPKTENPCRDALIGRLADRLQRFDVAAIQTETRQGEDTRSDGYVLAGSGRALPIEVKRQMHGDLWTATQDQLPDYVATEGSDGLGVYIVLWFGADLPMPRHPADAPPPVTAADLHRRLVDDLKVQGAHSLSVVVLDVSRPPPEGRGRRTRRVREPDFTA